jgi:hypothetical protein
MIDPERRTTVRETVVAAERRTPMPERWNDVIPHLTEFRSHLATGFPPLELEMAFDYGWPDEDYKTMLQRGHYYRPGVYLLYDETQCLRYIGKAMNFYKRIFKHRAYGTVPEAFYIDVVAFDPRCFYFTHALEHLLIVRLSPPRNKHCRNDHIPVVKEP